MSGDYTNPNLTPADYWWHDVDTAPRCSCGTRLERQPGQSTFYPCPFGCGDGEAS